MRFTYHVLTTPTEQGTEVRGYVHSLGSTTDRKMLAAWGGAAVMLGVALCDYYGVPRHRSVAYEDSPDDDFVVRLTAPPRQEQGSLCAALSEHFARCDAAAERDPSFFVRSGAFRTD